MRFFLIALGLLLAACSSTTLQTPAGFVRRQVAFQYHDPYRHLRGHLHLMVPSRYDTLQSWFDHSDTEGTRKYRLTSSTGCLLQESGWIHEQACNQTLDRLTIEVDRLFGDPGPDTVGYYLAQQRQRVEQMARLLHEELGGARTVWHTNQLTSFHQRPFTLQAYFGSRVLGGYPVGKRWKLEPYEQLIAATVIKYRKEYWGLTFRFECKQADCRHFAQQAKTILNSVEIEPEDKPKGQNWWL